jgi:hypothetical protein
MSKAAGIRAAERRTALPPAADDRHQVELGRLPRGDAVGSCPDGHSSCRCFIIRIAIDDIAFGRVHARGMQALAGGRGAGNALTCDHTFLMHSHLLARGEVVREEIEGPG